MKREVTAGLYFLVYIALPAGILHFIAAKYPEIGNSQIPMITMLFLLILFVMSIVSLYTKYTSIPTAISVIATIIYMNAVFSNMHISLMGANITIKMQTLLMIIYALLAVKIIIAIYSDVKQKSLSLSDDTEE